MRKINAWLDRFALRHPKFGIPNLMLYIAVANVAIGLLDTFSAFPLSNLLFFDRSAIFQGQVWRLVTFILVPLSSDFSLFNITVPGSSFLMTVLSAYFYYWIGSLLEREWGTAKFNCFFFTGVLLNILYGLVLGFTSMSYVNLSMFFAFAVLFPNMEVLFMFIIPMKVKWLAWMDAAYFLWQIAFCLFLHLWVWAFLPVVALFNFFLFFWNDFADVVARRKRRAKHQHSKQTIDFKAAQKKAKETRGYMHKCAVCGKTDADDPNMEFRYCSKCDGYYCYCMDHINDHVHIKKDD